MVYQAPIRAKREELGWGLSLAIICNIKRSTLTHTTDNGNRQRLTFSKKKKIKDIQHKNKEMKRGEKERWFSFIVRGCVSFSAVKENRRGNGRNQKRAAHQQIKKATGSSSAE